MAHSSAAADACAALKDAGHHADACPSYSSAISSSVPSSVPGARHNNYDGGADELALKVITRRRSPNTKGVAVSAPVVPVKHISNGALDSAETNCASAIAVEHAWRPLPHNIHSEQSLLEKPPVTLSDGVLADASDSLELNPTVFPNAQLQVGLPADENDDEVMHTFARVIKASHVMIPSKSQVLLYFANAQQFRLRRIGTDLQVTDPADFPLFDVWVEMDCCRCTWVIEAYGKVVMMMHEKPSNICCGPRRPPISILDWNGDLFGYLVPGDPFLMQNTERQTIAKLVPHAATAHSSTCTSSGLLQPAGHEIDQQDVTNGCVPNELNAPLSSSSLLMAHDDGTNGSLPNGTVIDMDNETEPEEQAVSWLCVMEGTGRHIVRLDGFDSIQYNKDVSFQMKLLALAAVIRLSAPWNMPRRGDTRAAVGGFWSFVSTILNFCAYCLY